MDDKLRQAADELEQHSHVDTVRREPDGLDDVVMVTADWVTESRMENNTRIIVESEYDGHVRKVGESIRCMDGVTVTRTLENGLKRKTFVVEPIAFRGA